MSTRFHAQQPRHVHTCWVLSELKIAIRRALPVPDTWHVLRNGFRTAMT